MRELNSKYIRSIVIFAVAFGLYYFFRSSPKSTPSDNHDQPELVEPVKSDTKKNETFQPGSTDKTLANGPERESSENQKTDEAKKTIEAWIATEAKTMNQPHVDTKQKDLELKMKIENFSEIEKNEILKLAHDTTKTANERILAAYMLVLDQSKLSANNLIDLAKKALPDFGPITAHSEAEIRRGQELAVRYMALDELANRASHNPEDLAALKKVVIVSESAEIRSYAERLLKKIK